MKIRQTEAATSAEFDKQISEEKNPNSEFNRKKHAEELFFLQLEEAAKISFIIALIAKIHNETLQLEKEFKTQLQYLREQDNKFIADTAEFEVQQQKLQKAIEEQLKLMQQKIMDLMNDFNKLAIYLEHLKTIYTKQLETLKINYAVNADALVEKVLKFIDELPVQQFHDNNNNPIYDPKDFIKKSLQPVFDSLKARLIEPKDFGSEVARVLSDCTRKLEPKTKRSQSKDHIQGRQNPVESFKAAIEKSIPTLKAQIDADQLVARLQSNSEKINATELFLDTVIDQEKQLQSREASFMQNVQLVTEQVQSSTINPERIGQLAERVSDVEKDMKNSGEMIASKFDEYMSMFADEPETPKAAANNEADLSRHAPHQ